MILDLWFWILDWRESDKDRDSDRDRVISEFRLGIKRQIDLRFQPKD